MGNRLDSESTPQTGASPFYGQFSDRFLNDSPSISAAQNAHTQAVVFKVAKAIRTPLDQLHFTVKTLCDAVIPGKTEYSGHFFAPIMQRLAQGAQRREGVFRLCQILSNISAIYLSRRFAPVFKVEANYCVGKSWCRATNGQKGFAKKKTFHCAPASG